MFLKEKKKDFFKLCVNRFMIFSKTKILLGNKIKFIFHKIVGLFFNSSYYLLICTEHL